MSRPAADAGDAGDAAAPDPIACPAATTCDCIVGIKSEVDDAGRSSCPGRGPIYCDRRPDGTFLARCAPP